MNIWEIIYLNCRETYEDMWRWINQHDESVGQRKILSSRQELNPWPPEHRAGAPSTEQPELMESKVRGGSLELLWNTLPIERELEKET